MAATHPRIAILGAGAVTVARHLPALQSIGAEAASVFDPSAKAAREAAESFQIPNVAPTARDAIEDDRVEAVLIASPNAFHREQAELALQAGRHVLCEKPISTTLADAAAMARAARQAGRELQVGFHHRYSAEHLCVKRLIELGVLGEVRAFSGIVSEPLDVIPGGLRNYRFDAAQAGGFTLIDVGQHRIDQIRDLLGDFAAVSCDMASVLADHDKDDSVVLSVRMESGAIGSLSWHRFSRGFTSPLMLYGTRATAGVSAMIAAPFQSAPVSIYLEDDPAEALPPEMLAWTRPARWWGDLEPGWVDIWPPRIDTFREQLLGFFSAIEQRTAPRAGASDGYKALELVQAAYSSYARGRLVSVPLPPEFSCPPPAW